LKFENFIDLTEVTAEYKIELANSDSATEFKIENIVKNAFNNLNTF